ncbi:MAG TPA: hypothetical protein PLF22_00430 [Pseudomonadales bacterium]|nr:hypothetical protein [Pseudomonadales bacterium]
MGVVAAILLWIAVRMHANGRRHYVERFVFPSTVKRKLAEAYPHLDAHQLSVILKGLREYFLVTQLARKKMVAMPSRAVDIAWHEFILCTHAYAVFCQKAFGYFLHHTPAEAMPAPHVARNSLKLAWKLACQRAGINPLSPDKIPLLFAVDSQLQIPNGFFYHLPTMGADMAMPEKGMDPGTIGCSSGCGGDSGGGNSCCGDGCGGGGCGGCGGD